MKFNKLGNSGLIVSSLCLGTMTFGQGSWGIGCIDQKGADEMVKYCLDKGINFFDTADVYSKGESETILGNALITNEVTRENVIIATKVRGTMGEDLNDRGLSRHHIMNSAEQSLKRLKMDYIDLYQVHSFDPITPLEETMSALNDLVRSGKVRYIGASNFAAWQLAKANNIARRYGWARFITFQGYYSLIGRGIENEIVPFCKDSNMGLLPWSPLAGGWLTGKYRSGNKAPKDARMQKAVKGFIPINQPQLERVLRVMDQISKDRKVSLATIALAWVKSKKIVSSVIIGARNIEQLEENILAGDMELTEQEMKKLDEVSEPELPYPHWMLKWTMQDRQL
jgi:aryl-alcohol dehydrogenase-like predicted oxidoreductase